MMSGMNSTRSILKSVVSDEAAAGCELFLPTFSTPISSPQTFPSLPAPAPHDWGMAPKYPLNLESFPVPRKPRHFMPTTLEHQLAAVDMQHLSRNVLRGRTCEKDASHRHFVRRAESAHRYPLLKPRESLVGHPGMNHGGVDRPWGDPVHANATLRVLARQRLDQGGHCRLGHGVRC